jgi:radical SAM superfamily enzyme YgiQ (UPF0313 family)
LEVHKKNGEQKLRVLLIQSYMGGYEAPVFPMGLSYLGAAMNEHDLKIFDPNISKRPYEDLLELLRAHRPEMVGISLRNIDSTNKRKVIFYYKYFREVIHFIDRNLEAPCKIAVGGPGFSIFSNEIMHDLPRIDYGVLFEGENTLSELTQNINTPENVKGLLYRKEREVVFSGMRPPINADELLTPDRRIVNMSHYSKENDDCIGVETKRGCALFCSYCTYSYLNGRRYRLISAESVVDDIERCLKESGSNQFMFIDPVFNIPKSHAESICSEIIRREIDVSWSAWFHDSYFSNDFIELIKRAGCRKIILSPDALHDHVLRKLGKGQRKSDIIATYKMLKASSENVEICYNFFKNPPGQSLQAFVYILDFYLRAKWTLKNRIHFEFNSLRIEPHTKLRDIAIEEGIISEWDNLLFPLYYTNQKTSYIEKLFNVILWIKDILARMKKQLK